AAGSIPITLLHPVFGQFQDDCDQYTPTKEDHDFVLKFWYTMSKFYPTEDDRAAEIRKALRVYGLDFGAEKVGGTRYSTDGVMRWLELAYAILEFKAEI